MMEFGKCTNHKNLPFLMNTCETSPNRVHFTVATAYTEFAGSCEAPAPILPDPAQTYRITFEGYILYFVRNESYSQDDEDYNLWDGDHFLLFRRSRLLDAIPEFTFCQTFPDGGAFTGPWKHYGIRCQDHTIDIISHLDPIIEKL